MNIDTMTHAKWALLNQIHDRPKINVRALVVVADASVADLRELEAAEYVRGTIKGRPVDLAEALTNFGEAHYVQLKLTPAGRDWVRNTLANRVVCRLVRRGERRGTQMRDLIADTGVDHDTLVDLADRGLVLILGVEDKQLNPITASSLKNVARLSPVTILLTASGRRVAGA